MTIKRGKKTESDREKRLAKSLGESKFVNLPALSSLSNSFQICRRSVAQTLFPLRLRDLK
jgi:hypothetical protein